MISHTNSVSIALNINLNNTDMISVIIPTHNRPLFLERAISSVMKQIDINEIIIVDDSTDFNKKENKQIIQNNFSIRYFPINCKGASYSRNFGAKHATGKYLAFLDDDDYWLDGYLESCYQLAEENISDIVLTGFLEEKNGIVTKEKMPPSFLTKNDFLVKNPGIRGSNLFIAKQLFSQVNGFDENLASHNDLDLGYRLFDTKSLSYSNNSKHLVVFNNDNRPRLSSINCEQKNSGIINFYNKYSDRMSVEMKTKFLCRASSFWNVEIV